jgi:hypothetical protein
MASAPASNAAEDPITGADNAVDTQPIVATYHGEEIVLADGWPQNATTCTEVAVGDVRCYDSVEEELKDLADESLGHAAAAKNQGMKVPGALDTKGLSPKPLHDVSAPSASVKDDSVGTAAISDCYYGYACLFDYVSYSGKILKWSADGTKTLDGWDFRDKAGSGCNNRSGTGNGAHVSDWRAGWDPELLMPMGGCYNFSNQDYFYGGSWNNKADAITLH